MPLSFWNRDRSITSLHNFTQHHHFPPHSLQFSPYTLMPSFTELTHYCHQMILGLSNERGLNTVAQNVFHCLCIAWKISHSSPPGLQSFTHVSAFLYPAVSQGLRERHNPEGLPATLPLVCVSYPGHHYVYMWAAFPGDEEFSRRPSCLRPFKLLLPS